MKGLSAQKGEFLTSGELESFTLQEEKSKSWSDEHGCQLSESQSGMSLHAAYWDWEAFSKQVNRRNRKVASAYKREGSL